MAGEVGVEIRRYDEVEVFPFGDMVLRELSPEALHGASIAEIIVPMGVQRPSRVSEKRDRVYVGLSGDIEFTVDGVVTRLGPGDVVHIAEGEEYGFYNGGYEEGRLLLIRIPGLTVGEG